MNKEKINKILFYLYNYENIDDLIEQRKNEIIDTVNVSSVAWIKSKQGNGNTLEDQVIKLIECLFFYLYISQFSISMYF